LFVITTRKDTVVLASPISLDRSQQPAATLRPVDRFLKRSLDLGFSLCALILFGWVIGIAYLLATIDTRQSGFFLQSRVGKDGKLFRTIKIRTMRTIPGIVTTVTTAHDPRITKLGKFLRKTNIDELPQLFNVLVGQMSLVGPRPDVPGFADQLTGDDLVILSIRPGITGPATLTFWDEEELLAAQADPEQYNREAIYPEKVRLNRRYIENYRLRHDLYYLAQTLIGRYARRRQGSRASHAVRASLS
jgi:lipopolysaccharide/colanic/teichoic acid biosynthesis glycosyltransferase